MKSLPVRWRLTLWYSGSLAALLLLFGGLIYGLMRERLLSRTDFELDEELHELALEVELADSRDELLRQLRLRFHDHETFEFQVSDAGGHRWFASRGLTSVMVPAPGDTQVTVRQFGSLRLPELGDSRLASQRVDARDGPLVLQAVLPLGRYLAELRDLRRLMLTTGPVMLLAAGAGGYWLARRALLPVDRMTHAAARITAAHLDERLQVVNPHDELGRLASTFNALLQRLQRSFDELRQFTADAAHEFRTPLAVIRSTAEVALQTPRSAEYLQERLLAVAEETARLTELSNQLLVLAREDSGLIDTEGGPVDLGLLIEGVVTDLEPLADDKSLTVGYEFPPDVLVIADPLRLRRVFMNLLDNAIKYTPPGGSVTLTLDEDDQHALAKITDTGVGIGAAHVPHICKRFYRVDSSRNRDSGGAGLGLAISRAIVESHGGRLEVSSQEGVGTCVTVELPICAHEEHCEERSERVVAMCSGRY